MCVNAKRKNHICGLCVKLRSLLKIHLQQVGFKTTPENITPVKQPCSSPLKLTLKNAGRKRANRRKKSTEKQQLDMHWKRLCSIKTEKTLGTIKVEQDETNLEHKQVNECGQNFYPDNDVQDGSWDTGGHESDGIFADDHKDDIEELANQSVESLPMLGLAEDRVDLALGKRASFVCGVTSCGKVFTSKLQFKRHQASHNNSKSRVDTNKYTCPCGKSFGTPRQLKRHKLKKESSDCTARQSGSDTEIDESYLAPAKGKKRGKCRKLIGDDRPYKCPICGKGSTRPDNLKQHMYTHETHKPFVCHCGKRYPAEIMLRKHQKNFHEGGRFNRKKRPVYTCDHEGCNESFTSKKNLKSHVFNVHQPKTFDCKVCPLKFTDPSELKAHLPQHTGLTTFTCFCGKYFLSERQLKEHQAVHDDARPYVCPICNKSFKWSAHLTGHMLTHEEHKPFACYCGKKFATAVLLRRHKKGVHKIEAPDGISRPAQVYQCDLCDASFRRRTFLDRHMKLHVVKNIFTCSKCDNKFPSQLKLDEHPCGSKSKEEADPTKSDAGTKQQFLSLEEYEKKVKRFLCDICGKRCATNCRLIEHKKLHTGELPYICPVCSKGFTENYKLNHHMKTHNKSVEDRKKIPCEYCGRLFATWGGLRNHIRMHTGEKPHKCPHCDYRTTQYSILKNHLTVHSEVKNFECKECNKRFKLKAGLMLHMQRHAGETRHECPVCQKRFLTAGAMKKHSATHSEARPFECPMCDSSFKLKEQLKNHIARHPAEHREAFNRGEGKTFQKLRPGGKRGPNKRPRQVKPKQNKQNTERQPAPSEMVEVLTMQPMQVVEQHVTLPHNVKLETGNYQTMDVRARMNFSQY